MSHTSPDVSDGHTDVVVGKLSVGFLNGDGIEVFQPLEFYESGVHHVSNEYYYNYTNQRH